MTSLAMFPRSTDKPIHVTDDDGEPSVALVIDIERHETFCSSPVNLTFTPSGKSDFADRFAELEAEIERLQRAIDQQVASIERSLTPDEARALAAVLVHFATEAERP